MQSDVKTSLANTKPTSKPQLKSTLIDEEIHNRRSSIFYALAFTILAGICGYFFTIQIISGETAIKLIWPSATAFLLLGILFCTVLTTKLSFLYQPASNAVITYSIIVFVLISAAIVLSLYLNKHLYLITVLFYCCLTFLPFTIWQSWQYYGTLTKPLFFKIWYLPPPGTTSVAATVFLNSIPVKIRLSPVAGSAENLYEAVIPGRMTVGEMFSFFLNDKQETTEQSDSFQDIIQNNYGWQFYTTTYGGLGLRQLDPELSLIENSIKENATIIIRRSQNQLPQGKAL